MDNLEFAEIAQAHHEEEIALLDQQDRGKKHTSLLRGNVTGAKQRKFEGQPNRDHHRPMSIGELSVRGRLK